MSGAVRCFVGNTKERRVGDRTTVPHERRIMSSGDHGTTIDVCTRSPVPCRVIILKRTMGIRSTGRGQGVHVNQRLREWERGVELRTEVKGRHVGSIEAGESVGVHAFSAVEDLREKLITVEVSVGMVAGKERTISGADSGEEVLSGDSADVLRGWKSLGSNIHDLDFSKFGCLGSGLSCGRQGHQRCTGHCPAGIWIGLPFTIIMSNVQWPAE